MGYTGQSVVTSKVLSHLGLVLFLSTTLPQHSEREGARTVLVASLPLDQLLIRGSGLVIPGPLDDDSVDPPRTIACLPWSPFLLCRKLLPRPEDPIAPLRTRHGMSRDSDGSVDKAIRRTVITP